MKNKNESLICAGIVTYNPNLERLEQNIVAIIDQVNEVILVDNNSTNQDEVSILCANYNVQLKKNEQNFGIARALNQIMSYAMENHYSWCITLDQDSVCPSNIVVTALKIPDLKCVGQIAPQIYEKNTGAIPSLDTKPNGSPYQEVKKCITSAAITNVAAWREAGGFDEQLFIDYVDFDFSVRIRKCGFKILRMNNVFLSHELGDSKIHYFFYKKVRVANHSPFRKYYICRNIIIYIRRHRQDVNTVIELLRLLKTITFVLLYEKQKRLKLKACINGIIDGIQFEQKSLIR